MNFVASSHVTPGGAPHGIFWNTLTYDQFVNGNVPGVQGGTIPILKSGSADDSNLIKILKRKFRRI